MGHSNILQILKLLLLLKKGVINPFCIVHEEQNKKQWT